MFGQKSWNLPSQKYKNGCIYIKKWNQSKVQTSRYVSNYHINGMKHYFCKIIGCWWSISVMCSLYLAKNHEICPVKNTEMDVSTSKNGIKQRLKYPNMFQMIIWTDLNNIFVKILCVGGVMTCYVHYVWPKIMKFARSKIQKWLYLHQKM